MVLEEGVEPTRDQVPADFEDGEVGCVCPTCGQLVAIYLQESHKLKSFARFESNGALPWLGSDCVLPDRSVL